MRNSAKCGNARTVLLGKLVPGSTPDKAAVLALSYLPFEWHFSHIHRGYT